MLQHFYSDCSRSPVPELPVSPSILGFDLGSQRSPRADVKRCPAVIQCDGYVIVEHKGKSGEVVPVHVDDINVVHHLQAFAAWRLYPNQPGHERYLRCNIRAGKSVRTLYAHDFLFRDWAAEEEGVKIRVTPRDGNYLNLTSSNFRKAEPRSKEEVEKFLRLITPDVFAEMLRKAKRALKDDLRAENAIGATLDHVMSYLEAARGAFDSDQKFINWVFTTLEMQIRAHKFRSDIVLDRRELRMRVAFAASEVMCNIPAGKHLGPVDESNSGSAASSLRTDRQDDRPAQRTCCPLPTYDCDE